MTARQKPAKNRLKLTDHTDDVMAILYRLGGGTVEQVGAMLMHLDPERWEESGSGAHVAAQRTLRLLREQGLAEGVSLRRTWIGKTDGKPETFYRLRREGGGKGIVMGAQAAQCVDATEALLHYRRAWSGGGIGHASMRVDYFSSVLDGARYPDAGAYVDPELVWSETHPSYPLVGGMLPDLDAAGQPRKRGSRGTAPARRIYSRLVPDGQFEVEFDEGFSSPFYVEIERRTNARVVAEKVQRYAGRWLRVLKDEQVYEVRPLVIVHYDPRRARRARPAEGAGAHAMRDALRERLYGAGSFGELREALKTRDPFWEDLGRMVLVCDWHAVLEAPQGAHAPGILYPIGAYPDDGTERWARRVGLYEAARERARAAACKTAGGA